MTNNGNFKIQIACDTRTGITYIGSGQIKRALETTRDLNSEYVYGIQIGHRCAAQTPDGWRVMTWRDAEKNGYRTVGFAGKR